MPSPSSRVPEPMYATLGHELPTGAHWIFEPKYDGMRVIAEVSTRQVRLVTRNGKEKSTQFPELVLALRELARRAGRPLLLDGEVVARKRRRRRGVVTPEASEFQQLQARMHLKEADEIVRLAVESPTTLVVFDLLRDGRSSLVERPWRERRDRLEALFDDAGDPDDATLTISDTSARGSTMLSRARRAGWEGIIAKRTDARYHAGARTDAWRKLKLLFRAEFVVGGYTEPRNSRQHIGALLLGAYDKQGDFIYVGHTGGGFTRQGLADMYALLEKHARKTSPFAVVPRTNERAHWVAPKVVVEVKFAEWTKERLLRQPIFLGTRDDKAARDVTIEGVSLQRWGTGEMKNDAA
ncbi:MAG TPA: non-homologous end-joining DNA ligase [Gemmatimonadaceae bacterium]|nr:non-homologous end-joining DNA ligase [Gemmatimonadaceae bacterium]